MAEHSEFQGFLSKYMPLGSYDSGTAQGSFASDNYPLNGAQGGISTAPIFDGLYQPAAHSQDPKIADKEGERAVQKLLGNDSKMTSGPAAIGVVLLSLMAMLGFRIRRRRGTRLAAILPSGGGQVSHDMSMPRTPASSDNILELKVHGSIAEGLENMRSRGWLPLVPPVARPRRAVALRALAEDLLAAEGAALTELVENNFETIDPATMETIQQADPAIAERVTRAFAEETDRRMMKAKERLEYILDAGELLEMDRRLTTLFKQGQADMALLLCLNMNVEGAEPGTDKHSIMNHLYTRAQEEFEKKADPAKALVHKLCRQPDAAIRDNILRTYLAPQTELIAPDATRIPLATPSPPQISHESFADAIAGTVEQLRSIDADGDLVNANIECCREIAKEARLVLIETGAPESVRAFEEELAKTWPMGSPDGQANDGVADTVAGGVPEVADGLGGLGSWGAEDFS